MTTKPPTGSADVPLRIFFICPTPATRQQAEDVEQVKQFLADLEHRLSDENRNREHS